MRIIDVISIGSQKVLMLDDSLPSNVWDKVSIDGVVYDTTPVYDLSRCVAIEAEGSFVGKTIKFI